MNKQTHNVPVEEGESAPAMAQETARDHALPRAEEALAMLEEALAMLEEALASAPATFDRERGSVVAMMEETMGARATAVVMVTTMATAMTAAMAALVDVFARC